MTSVFSCCFIAALLLLGHDDLTLLSLEDVLPLVYYQQSLVLVCNIRRGRLRFYKYWTS